MKGQGKRSFPLKNLTLQFPKPKNQENLSNLILFLPKLLQGVERSRECGFLEVSGNEMIKILKTS